ncbi:S41 family peptidase [Acetobacter nitrogenifigens]|uniref:S41 family peptidase n=1 Tax=Acetobacter nitrogenifigens TaxID=285268 RepID=UPI001378D7A4
MTAPLTILINKASFSAAEKLTAEIQDNRAGVILGDWSAGGWLRTCDGRFTIKLTLFKG